MRIALDAAGVAELTRRFGQLHDSMVRSVSSTLGREPGKEARTEIVLDALSVDGTWWRMTLVVNGVREFRFAEGVALWENAETWEMTTHHRDGTSTTETKHRNLGDLRVEGPSNQVIFEAAIHVVPEGVFVDLSPYSLDEGSGPPDFSMWRLSTFYVFGRSGEARLEPLDDGAKASDLRAELLGEGAITMFHRRELFDGTVSRLEAAGYRVHVVDASSQEVFGAQMTRVMRFKESFGYEPWTGNLDALNDAFREVDCTSVVGVVFAFVRFDLLNAEDPHTAHLVLDIVERASWDRLLAGQQLIGLVQSDDPRLALAPVGARAPRWTGAEWLDSNRGV